MNIRLQIEKQKYKEEGQMGTELDSGSEEYRECKELAENIYRDYCGADNTVDKRHYKKKGDNLKATMISEYGSRDESVRYIINNFLDLWS